MRFSSALLLVIAVVAPSLLGCPAPKDPPDDTPVEEPTPYTPRWAFRPWISKDISTRDDTFAFVQGFADRDIPVGAVVLDSPWASNYNSFIPNPSRYPDFKGMVDTLHARDIKLVVWTTQMINASSFDVEQGGDTYDGPSPNFAEAKRNNYFVDNGHLNLWWKGQGGAIDFFNPDAVKFWEGEQDKMLELGLDGWKLDFGEDYIEHFPIPTADGEKSRQEYSEAYLRNFWRHGRIAKGREFVTMTRPWDESYNFPGRFYAKVGEASVHWVGDNRRDWVGLADALDHILRSAAAGYVAVGSDIGGYLDRDDKDLLKVIPADTEVFIRWTAVGALTPFMQLHGRANATPWTVPDRVDESVAAWKYWGNLHDDLGPFWYSLAQQAHAGGAKLMRPIGELPWMNDYRYQLGDAFFVAPLLAAGGTRDVALPAGHRYFDWWDVAAEPLNGGQTLTAYAGASALPRIPLFVLEGAIVPMNVKTAFTGLGTPSSAGQLTIAAWPGAEKTAFQLVDDDDAVTDLSVLRSGKTVTATSSRAMRPILFRLWTGTSPTSVTVNGEAAPTVADLGSLAASNGVASFYDAATRTTWARAPAGGETTVTVQLP